MNEKCFALRNRGVCGALSIQVAERIRKDNGGLDELPVDIRVDLLLQVHNLANRLFHPLFIRRIRPRHIRQRRRAVRHVLP